MSKKPDIAAAMAAKLAHEKRQEAERRIAELAARPVETARRMLAMEDALRKIDNIAQGAIDSYGITQESPEKWVQLGDLVRQMMAPIRDASREGRS